MGDLYGSESDPIYMESMDLVPFWCKHWNVWKSNITKLNCQQNIDDNYSKDENKDDDNGYSNNDVNDKCDHSIMENILEINQNGNENFKAVAANETEINSINQKEVEYDFSKINLCDEKIVFENGNTDRKTVDFRDFQTNIDRNKESVKNKITKEEAFEVVGGFSEKEKKVLSSGCLRNKEYLIEEHSADEKATFLSLADLLFSFCFDHR